MRDLIIPVPDLISPDHDLCSSSSFVAALHGGKCCDHDGGPHYFCLDPVD